jgi:hypothetical protein
MTIMDHKMAYGNKSFLIKLTLFPQLVLYYACLTPEAVIAVK